MPLFRAAFLIVCACLCLCGQPPQPADAPGEARGLPPRATPADYQVSAQAGTLTIAAEFKAHAVPTMEGPLSTDDYVVVELGLYGPPDARLRISASDFTLRINRRKQPLPAQAFGWVLPSLKDPEWVPPEEAESKSKSKLSAGGGGQQSEPGASPPAPPKIPVPVMRAMAQRVQRSALPEGDRPLPQAGLIFFQYRGKAQSIRAVELLYAGPAGQATLTLQP
ncbi:MAG TPA: hypothetical protein VLH09_00830 [Bryobacteraceae bacterium]|nr:hypothetical protein [Bryobacteraceae bacterium]